MPEQPPNEDEPMLRRLRDVSGGDAGARQLRERYDLLQQDYQVLLDRLGQLEARLRGTLATPEGEQPPFPPPLSLREQIRAPLLQLRHEYERAIEELRDLVEGLDLVANGRMKRQRGMGGESGDRRPASARLEVAGGSPGDILDFQQRLSTIRGVMRVTIDALDDERATLTVELDAGREHPGT